MRQPGRDHWSYGDALCRRTYTHLRSSTPAAPPVMGSRPPRARRGIRRSGPGRGLVARCLCRTIVVGAARPAGATRRPDCWSGDAGRAVASGGAAAMTAGNLIRLLALVLLGLLLVRPDLFSGF